MKLGIEIILWISFLIYVRCDSETRRTVNDHKKRAVPIASARTFFYDDHQIFFTLMIYFPFIVDIWSYGIPLTAVNELWPGSNALFREGKENGTIEPEEPSRTSGDVTHLLGVTSGPVSGEDNQQFQFADDNNTLTNILQPIAEFKAPLDEDDEYYDYEELNFTTPLPDYDTVQNEPKHRSKRTLYVQDQEIDIFLCLSMPFSVPILKYDEDVISAYWNKKARKKYEQNLPQIPVHDDEFLTGDDPEDDVRKQAEDDDEESDESKRKKRDSNSRRTSPRLNDRFGGIGLYEFGHHDKTSRQPRINSKSCVPPKRRRPYFETMFSPIENYLEDDDNKQCTRRQLWTPLDDSVTSGTFLGRSSTGKTFSDRGFALAQIAMASVSERIVDVLETFPVNCTERVLCRMSTTLASSSPLQAIMLYTFGGRLFGLTENIHNAAILAGLENVDCLTKYGECGINGF